MPNSVIGGVCFALAPVLVSVALPMIIPGSRRAGMLLMLAALVLASIPFTISPGESYIGHSAMLSTRLMLPPPLVFFPTTAIASVLIGSISVYRKNIKLQGRINELADQIVAFRLDTEAKRPVLIKHPVTGKPNIHQLQAVLDFQKREHFAYLSKFRAPLAELAKEIARQGVSTEGDLIAAFYERRDAPKVEQRLLSLAEKIGQPKRALSWHAVRASLLLGTLPTFIWLVWFVASQ